MFAKTQQLELSLLKGRLPELVNIVTFKKVRRTVGIKVIVSAT